MISKKEDYSYLLDELRSTSYRYYWDTIGRVVNKDREEQTDESIISSTDFYMTYCIAYLMMEKKDNNVEIKIDRAFMDRALTSYGAFNYLINTIISEYRVYGDIGTGKVSYIPYQQMADYLFLNEDIKTIVMEYLKNKLNYIFDEEKSKVRVK